MRSMVTGTMNGGLDHVDYSISMGLLNVLRRGERWGLWCLEFGRAILDVSQEARPELYGVRETHVTRS